VADQPALCVDAARYFCLNVAGIVDNVDVVTEAAVHSVGAYAAVEQVVAGDDLPVGGLGPVTPAGAEAFRQLRVAVLSRRVRADSPRRCDRRESFLTSLAMSSQSLHAEGK
jgi:hypothetical protein